MSTRADKQAKGNELMRPDEDVATVQEDVSGVAAVQALATAGKPSPDGAAAVLAQHPGETNAIVAFMQKAFGNAFTDEALASPAANALLEPDFGGGRAAPAAPSPGLHFDEDEEVSAQPAPVAPMPGPTNAAPTNAVPGGQAAPAVKTPINTTKKEAEVLNKIRGHAKRLDPTWLSAAQTKVGATPTGAMNTETLRKFREFTGKAALGASDIMAASFLADDVPGSKFFDFEETDEITAKKNNSANADFDTVAIAAGASSYADWQSEWTNIKLLGHNIGQGHRHLAERVQVADKYLRAKHGKDDQGNDRPDADIRGAVGWDGSSNGAYYSLGLHMHSMGLALDIHPGKNPWVFRGKAQQIAAGAKRGDTGDDFYEKLFIIATNVYGGEPITSKLMYTWSQELSTEELHEKLRANSDAIKQYMDLTQGDEATFIQTLVDSGKYDRAKATSIAGRRQIHWNKFHSADRDQQNVEGITNMELDLVIALRDVAGLAWGAGDLSSGEGGMNGDMMHFDCRNDGVGGAVLRSIRAVEG